MNKTKHRLQQKAIPVFLVYQMMFPSLGGFGQSPDSAAVTGSALTAVWANTGEDKILQDEVRASTGAAVVNSAWDGTTIRTWGARNEVVSFSLVLEAASRSASNVSVSFDTLTGPGGSTISAPPPSPATIFDWTSRNIELFYVRYLQIKGLSKFGYSMDDERLIPLKLQRPQPASPGVGVGGWVDRPGHDKFFPDIAVPLELTPSFNIAVGNSQMIWCDIYIPKTAAAGIYTGTVSIREGGAVTKTVPVSMLVKNFTLPDVPSGKTMLPIGQSDMADRITGGDRFPNGGTPNYIATEQAMVNTVKMVHRHKISAVSEWGSVTNDHPNSPMDTALTGSMFSPANHYGGPGTNTGNDVYSILTYIGVDSLWVPHTQASFVAHAAAWQSWFNTNAPGVERFVYLCDECHAAAQMTHVDQDAAWINSAGVGLKTFVTNFYDFAAANEPNVSIVASTGIGTSGNPGDNRVYMPAAISTIRSRGGEVWNYNTGRPGLGSFMTDDDGVALREGQWGIYKKGLGRRFFWFGNYWNDYQTGSGQSDVYTRAATFGGGVVTQDSVLGENSPTHSNGDGVMLYPGKDAYFPANNYNVLGTFASLRLKYWRRGVQDIDYITLADSINSSQTQAIVARMVPKVLWDIQDLGGYVGKQALAWSINPDDWEAARSDLAAIIEGKSSGGTTSLTPSAQDFGSQNLGTATAAKLFSFVNGTGSSVQILGTSISGANAADFAISGNSCGGSIAAGGVCTISVLFNPSAAGLRSALLNLTDSSTGAAKSANLTGTGVDPGRAVVSPAALTFGTQTVGSVSGAQPVVLRNTGGSTFSIGTVSMTGGNAADFAQTNSCGASLAPGGSCPLSVTFQPVAAGARSSTLTVNTSVGTQTVALSGTGADIARISASPGSLSFASQTVGTNSPIQTVTLSNSGGSDLGITGIAIGGLNPGDFAQTNNCGGTLTPSSSCVLSVMFQPSASGTRAASINISTSVGLQSVPLTGVAAGPAAVTVTPSSVVFSSQTVGTTSAAKTVSVSNSGGSTLGISGVVLSGANAADFIQTNTCGATLAPGSSCVLTLTFQPTASGTRVASVAVNTALGTQTISVSGTAVTAASLTVTPGSLSFASQVRGTSSAAQTITINNGGGSSLAITSIALGGPNASDFAQTNSCGANLSAGATCTASVIFQPNSAGSLSAALVVTSAAGTQSVLLSGTGVNPAQITSSPASLSFPGQLTGTLSAAQPVTISNSGGVSLSIASVSLTGANPADFLLSNGCGSTLAPSSSCAVSISYQPVAAGASTASLSVVTSAGTLSAALSGTATSTTGGPVGYWTFDSANLSGNQAFDISGNSLTATLRGSVTATSGQIGQGLHFGGTNGYLAVGSDPRTDLLNDVTLSLWLQTRNTSRTEGLVSRYSAAGAESGYLLRTNPSGHVEFRLGGRNLPGGRPKTFVDTGILVNDGQWHHVAAVVTMGDAVTIYVDGAKSSQFPANPSIGLGNSPLTIGVNPWTDYGMFYTGDLDELRVYNRKLDASEIAKLANATPPPPPPPPSGPVLSVTPSTASFNAVVGDGPGTSTVSIANTGAGSLNWTANSNQPWLTVSPGSGTGPGSLLLTATSGGLSPGTYSAIVTVDAAGASGSPQKVNVTLSVSAAPAVTSGLGAYWTFDTANMLTSQALDSSGNNTTAFLRGTASIGTGAVGQALTLNGTNAYLTTGNEPLTNGLTSVSVALWLKTSNTSRVEALVSRYSAAGTEAGYLLRTNAAGNLEVRVGGHNLAAGRPRNFIDSGKPINDGSWHHVAAVLTLGQGISFYVDGVLNSFSPANLLSYPGLSYIQLGLNPWPDYGANFTGALDDVRVYWRSLSAAEVGQLTNLRGSTSLTTSDEEVPEEIVAEIADDQK